MEIMRIEYALRRKYRITQKEISAAMGVSRMRFVDIEQYGKPGPGTACTAAGRIP
ncbi:hypothetical protein [Ruthenibacterium lactatiformans]|uniref:hypothetical protein n=1 Tax=Ruthenibacterium lactatiformans TaxID=1550024 RepID=UPI0039A2EC65